MLEFIASKGWWSSGSMVLNPSYEVGEFWGFRQWASLLERLSLQAGRDNKEFIKPHRMTFPTTLRKRLDLRLVCSQADNNYGISSVSSQEWNPEEKPLLSLPCFFFFLFSVNNTQKPLWFYFNKQKIPLLGSVCKSIRAFCLEVPHAHHSSPVAQRATRELRGATCGGKATEHGPASPCSLPVFSPLCLS